MSATTGDAEELAAARRERRRRRIRLGLHLLRRSPSSLAGLIIVALFLFLAA